MADVRDAAALDELQHLDSLLFDRGGLGFCGCGNPDDAYNLVRDLLALAPFFDHRTEVQNRIGGGPGVKDLVLYAIDGAGLIEHGGGIGGSWLTAKGRHYLSLMRRHEYEEIEGDGVYLPHDGEPCETVKCRHWQAGRESFRDGTGDG